MAIANPTQPAKIHLPWKQSGIRIDDDGRLDRQGRQAA
jgi:hypothetical protein